MLKKIEHIGIAVKDLNKANEIYSKILNSKPYKQEFVDSENVMTSFFKIGDSKIEILDSRDEQSAINKFIQKKGEGIHHIAFEVEDIQSEMQRLIEEGFHCLNEIPKKGADNKLVCFFHPKDSCGVLIELCQEIIT
ncbi:MAG: methylmalonyl-CoA epimerase [Saprospiraceae bacterium]|nr:methylmalonyl-CoA epimerase [Saprospiraceae bacterium]